MYRKKTTIIIVMCIAILVMGVGYALLSTQLNINGSTAVTSSWRVEFSAIRTKSLKGGATNLITPNVTATTATFNVDLVQPGDKIVYEIDITNYGDITAEIKGASYVIDGSDAIYIEIEGIRKGTKIKSCEGLDTCPFITALVTVGYEPNTEKEPTEKTKTIEITLDIGQYVEGSPTTDGVLIPELVENSTLVQQILRDNTAQSDAEIDFSQPSSDTNGKGLYYTNDDDGVSYYFRGDVKNNYVQFGTYAKDTTITSYDFLSSWISVNKNIAKDTPMYWRIIRINGDGTIRLMYIGTEPYENGASVVPNVPATEFNTYGSTSTDTLIKHYTYMSGNSRLNSNVKTVVESWYSNNLDSSSKTLVADSNFCNDTQIAYRGDNNSITYKATERLNAGEPTLTCGQSSDVLNVKNGKLSQPVALITADEVMMAGAGVEIGGTHYLELLGYAWTMTPNGYGIGDGYLKIWSIEYDKLDDYSCENDFSCGSVGGYSYANPVINLKADVTISDGNGTKDAPYIIKAN